MRSRRYKGNGGNAYTAIYKGHTENTELEIGAMGKAKTQKSIAYTANVNLTQIAQRSQILKPGRLRDEVPQI
jgi:hypothetical protein